MPKTPTKNLCQLGITVMPEFIQCEGIDTVLENVVHRCQASTIATAPSVLAPSSEIDGTREPPSDSGAGLARLLDRSLWGKRELRVTSAPSYASNRSLYTGLALQPPEPSPLTDSEGPKVAQFLKSLKDNGVETQIQITAAMPPGFRVQARSSVLDDGEAITFDGRNVGGRVDGNLSLAHPELRGYMTALIRDLIDNYPSMDVIRFDWPEYPPYKFDSLAFDFHPAAIALGQKLGHDVTRLRAQLLAVAPEMRAMLGTQQLRSFAKQVEPGKIPLSDPSWSAFAELIAYRQSLVLDYAKFLKNVASEASGGRLKCHFLCFAPPFNTLSGFSINDIDPLASDISVKAYSMHWSMIEREYVNAMLEYGAQDADACLYLVRKILGTSPNLNQPFSELRYPRPDEAHEADDDVLKEKIQSAEAQTRHANLWALSHSYGPLDDVVRRFHAARRATNNVHINRYGYMSDAKIDAISKIMASEK